MLRMPDSRMSHHSGGGIQEFRGLRDVGISYEFIVLLFAATYAKISVYSCEDHKNFSDETRINSVQKATYYGASYRGHER